MYRLLLKIQLKIMSVVLAGLIGFGAVGAVVQSTGYNSDVTRYEQDQKEIHFFKVIAGVEAGSAPTVDNLLARDLRAIMHDDTALDAFRGNSNRYGGITDAVGYDPFADEGLSCFECGPLDGFTKTVVRNIANGDTFDLQPHVIKPVSGYELTPFGLSISVTIGLYWLLGGTLSLLAAHRILKATHSKQSEQSQTKVGVAMRAIVGDPKIYHSGGYDISDRTAFTAERLADLPWELKGDQQAEKLAIKILAPPYFVYYSFIQHRSKVSIDRQVRAAFPDHMRVIDKVDQTLKHANDTDFDVVVLKRRRNRTMQELTQQALSGEDRSEQQLEDLLGQLESTEEFLKARLTAKKELESKETPSV